MECVTYRFRAHSMFDAELYRQKTEVSEWRQRDPINQLMAQMKADGTLTDADLAAMIAYLKQVPPADSDWGERRVGFPLTVLGGLVAFDDFTRINGIAHEAVGGDGPPAGATSAFGEYMVNIAMCGECHAANFAGVVGSDGPPPGPNLTPGGELGDWTEADFIQTIRTGQTPSGEQLDSEQMPWATFSQMSDTELQAIWAYLQSLPALPDNS